VLETAREGRWLACEIHHDPQLAEADRVLLEEWARRAGIVPQVASPERLRQLCGSGEHQGLVARMTPFPYAEADRLLAERSACPLFVVLDGVQDAYNFGAMLRCAAAFGVEAVFIGEARQVEVTSQVVRSSAGALRRVPIARVPDVRRLLESLRAAGIAIVGTSLDADGTIAAHDFRRATALVLGNEATGVSDEVLALCDARVRIPHAPDVESLNAAVATGIVLYEAHRQRGAGERCESRRHE
jgi:23S rRNA (guanosine2251-2'-O)-methyltransferase